MNIRFEMKRPDEIFREITRQARGKRLPVKCPNCGATNHIDAADILTGGKEVGCTSCTLIFRLEGPKRS